MNRFLVGLSLVVSLGLASFPAAASANVVLGARVELTDTEAVVVVDTTERVGEPQLKVEKGRVRVWLPDMKKHPRLDVPASDAGFESVRIRPGSTGLVLVDLRLSERRPIAREAIRFEASTTGIRIAILRSALPSPPRIEVVPVEAPAPVAPTAGATPSVGVPVEPAPAAAPSVTPVTPSAPAPIAAPSRSEEAALGVPDTSSSTAGMLLLVTVLLGGLYALVRYYQLRRGSVTPKSDIQVVSVRRLGPKHQLVLVRALGEEHLLSVTPAGTQRLRSSVAGDGDLDESVGEPAPTSTSRLSAGPRAVRTEDDAAPPHTESFKSEVLRLTGLGRTEKAPKKSRAAVGGEQARSLFPKRVSEDHDPEPSPGSDSVAGILRLRRRNGR